MPATSGRTNLSANHRSITHFIGGFMKATLLASLFFISGFSISALSQETPPAQASAGAVGLGIGYNTPVIFARIGSPIPLSIMDFATVQIPIRLSPTVRFEPEIGYLSESIELSYSSQLLESSASMVRISGGLMFIAASYGSTNIYVGPRIAAQFYSTTETTPGFMSGSVEKTESKGTNLFFMGCVGAEHFFSPHFSLGAEVQLSYVSFGKPETTVTTPSPFPSPIMTKRTIFGINSLTHVRWYF
jgi:hypothetical protein